MSATHDILAMAALGVAAGGINALAGGGPIVVVAALAALGLPANVASLTSTLALMPGQAASVALKRRSHVALPGDARWLRIALVALVGGAAGAALLLATPAATFARLLPFLIVFATAHYAWQSRIERPATAPAPPGRSRLWWWLPPLAVYGGFYGGGNSFLVMALLAALGCDHRAGAHAKNRIILLINAAASGVFLWSGQVAWTVAWPLGIGALAGGLLGAALIDRIDARLLRLVVIAIGGGLALFLVVRG